jgi:hypothetical protein
VYRPPCSAGSRHPRFRFPVGRCPICRRPRQSDLRFHSELGYDIIQRQVGRRVRRSLMPLPRRRSCPAAVLGSSPAHVPASKVSPTALADELRDSRRAIASIARINMPRTDPLPRTRSSRGS